MLFNFYWLLSFYSTVGHLWLWFYCFFSKEIKYFHWILSSIKCWKLSINLSCIQGSPLDCFGSSSNSPIWLLRVRGILNPFPNRTFCITGSTMMTLLKMEPYSSWSHCSKNNLMINVYLPGNQDVVGSKPHSQPFNFRLHMSGKFLENTTQNEHLRRRALSTSITNPCVKTMAKVTAKKMLSKTFIVNSFKS